MHKWSDQWKAEGEQIGIQKGREEGRQEAGADILRSLLKLKFGPEAVTDFQEPIARSDAEQLRIWAERVLTADSPEDVFRS